MLTFRAVAHKRSFSRAAEELSLSQPSVSNQVASLEREIGARLLERAPGGLRLTREGKILLEHADAIAERFELAREQLATAAEGQRARLRIGAFPTALAGLVPAAIARLRLHHPDTKVAVDEGTQDLPARVRSGELHLAVAFQDTARPRQEPPGLERRDLFREPFMVALAPDHRLAERAEVRLADLGDDDWTAAVTDGLIVGACRAAGFEPNLVSITHDQLAIRALVTRGLAVTLAPQLLADAFKDVALRRSPAPAPSATSTPCCHPAADTRCSHPSSTRSTRPPPSPRWPPAVAARPSPRRERKSSARGDAAASPPRETGCSISRAAPRRQQTIGGPMPSNSRSSPSSSPRRRATTSSTSPPRSPPTRGWMVPAYTLPPNAEHVTIMRALVKLTLGHTLASTLADDIAQACETLAKKGGVHELDRRRVKTGTGY